MTQTSIEFIASQRREPYGELNELLMNQRSDFYEQTNDRMSNARARTWKTDNLETLKAAFIKMNKQSGLKSELMPFEKVLMK